MYIVSLNPKLRLSRQKLFLLFTPGCGELCINQLSSEVCGKDTVQASSDAPSFLSAGGPGLDFGLRCPHCAGDSGSLRQVTQ